MSTNLGVLPSNAPLKTGKSQRLDSSATGSTAWPSPENYLWFGPGAPGNGFPGQVGPVLRPERFWWIINASLIAHCNTGWQRYDHQIRLVDSVGSPILDLNGNYYFQKANSTEGGAIHTNPWIGSALQAAFFCEANTTYYAQLLSKSSSPNVSYWIGMPHMTMYSYTVGEGGY